MPPRIETRVEGEPYRFPYISRDTIDDLIKVYASNPSDFFIKTGELMLAKGDEDLFDRLEEMFRQSGPVKQIARVAAITWRALDASDPSLPPAILEKESEWFREPPPASYYRRENPDFVDWVLTASRSPIHGKSIRNAAVGVYRLKRRAFSGN